MLHCWKVQLDSTIDEKKKKCRCPTEAVGLSSPDDKEVNATITSWLITPPTRKPLTFSRVVGWKTAECLILRTRKRTERRSARLEPAVVEPTGGLWTLPVSRRRLEFVANVTINPAQHTFFARNAKLSLPNKKQTFQSADRLLSQQSAFVFKVYVRAFELVIFSA